MWGGTIYTARSAFTCVRSHALRTMLLETMACASMADGKVTEGELETLAAAYNNLAQSRASLDHIRSIQQSVASLGLQVRMALSLLVPFFSSPKSSTGSSSAAITAAAARPHVTDPTRLSI